MQERIGALRAWKKNGAKWTSLLLAVLCTVLATFVPLISQMGALLERLSYDMLFLGSPPAPLDEVVLVKLGASAYRSLNQVYPQFDRAIHAEFLRKLAKDGAKLVVYDIFFEHSTPSDAKFAEAIREHGNVVIGFDTEPINVPGTKGVQRIDPAPAFLDLPGCRLGKVGLFLDADRAARRFPNETAESPTLHSAAAAALGRAVPARADGGRERWIRYYGPDSHFTTIDFANALTASPEMFRDKVVFIGGKPKTLHPSSDADEFRTGLTRWSGTVMPGVDIQATLFLNLTRRDWFSRLGRAEELALLTVVALATGIAMGSMQPVAGLFAGAFAAGLVWATVAGVAWSQNLWFNWLIIPLGQIPAAWLAALVLRARRAERALKEAKAPSDEALPTIKEDAGTNVLIRDYELIKCVGRGAYGEVWLARSVIGAFRAVKIVYKRNFADARPFEREFEGVRNFEPISRQHPGWVSILHVAKDENGAHFYYVMEPADDLSGGALDPLEYQPKTLGALLSGRKRLPPAQVLDLGIKLADALAALHERGLVHRDIKPSNIVFSNGHPKLADIGLVVQAGQGQSFVGTEGYIPPEGPGTPLADIYSLGCVLFQAATGRNSPGRGGQWFTPEEAEAESAEIKKLLEVFDRACANFHGKRYQSAAEMREHLARLQTEIGSNGPTAPPGGSNSARPNPAIKAAEP